MADSEDTGAYESTDSGSAQAIPKQCSALKKGHFVLIKDHPCQIKETSTSKTGKHGHAKVNMVGLDIFTGKKYEDMSPSTHTMQAPLVRKRELTVIDVDQGYVSAMDNNTSADVLDNLQMADICEQQPGKTFQDLKAAYDEAQTKDADVLITLTEAMGLQFITDFKTNTKPK